MRLDTVLTLIVAAASSAAVTPQTFAGTWKGRMLDQPAVDLRLKAEGATLGGVAVFYKIDPSAGGPAEKVEAPLRDVKIDKGVLSFGVRRVEDGGVTRLQMRLLPSGDAELKTLADGPDTVRAGERSDEPVLTLKKE